MTLYYVITSQYQSFNDVICAYFYTSNVFMILLVSLFELGLLCYAIDV